ncbi:MAG: hypothetical protein OEZ06_28965 [Myxococcales bacterium]|nr:hypothetical protein [Myxococcales bacterium]
MRLSQELGKDRYEMELRALSRHGGAGSTLRVTLPMLLRRRAGIPPTSMVAVPLEQTLHLSYRSPISGVIYTRRILKLASDALEFALPPGDGSLREHLRLRAAQLFSDEGHLVELGDPEVRGFISEPERVLCRVHLDVPGITRASTFASLLAILQRPLERRPV